MDCKNACLQEVSSTGAFKRLTRDEAAALIRHCWRYRKKQTIHSGKKKVSASAPMVDSLLVRAIDEHDLVGIFVAPNLLALALLIDECVASCGRVGLWLCRSFTMMMTRTSPHKKIQSCVYRKPKLGRSGGEVRQGWRAI
jgi:hypothetical protein